jgi:ferritin-like metal-binding protein YciE
VFSTVHSINRAGYVRPRESAIGKQVADIINSTEKHMKRLRHTFIEELKDIYDAEKQITRALPKMIKAAEHEDLRMALQDHLNESEAQIDRLERVFEIFDEPIKPKRCRAMQGLIEECEDLIKEKKGDAALIASVQKIEHYEIATYGSLVSWASLLAEQEAAGLLEDSLSEEKETDETLTDLAESSINPDEAEEKPSGKLRKDKSGRQSTIRVRRIK